jgi:hypothetical protein
MTAFLPPRQGLKIQRGPCQTRQRKERHPQMRGQPQMADFTSWAMPDLTIHHPTAPCSAQRQQREQAQVIASRNLSPDPKDDERQSKDQSDVRASKRWTHSQKKMALYVARSCLRGR